MLNIRTMINLVICFTNIDFCIDYLKSVKNEKIFLVISSDNAFKILSNIIDLIQLDSIFIFSQNRYEFNCLHNNYNKIVNIFDNSNEFFTSIESHVENVDSPIEVLSFYDQHQRSARNLSEQSAEFLWFQLFQDVIKHLSNDDQAKQEMLIACRQYYKNNHRILKNIDEFEQNYHKDECIQWYTRNTFIYKLINKALRTEDIEQLYIFRYYISDLSKQLAQEYEKLKRGKEKKFYLYRGTTINKTEAQNLVKNINKLIATNAYWSTSRNRSYALTFANTPRNQPDLMALLFEIECNLNDCNDSVIFADIAYLSNFEKEEEVLFDVGSIFYIENVREEEEGDTKLFVIKLRPTGEGRELANKYIEQNREQMEEEGSRIMLSTLLKRMGKFEKSLQFLQYLLKHPGEENIAYIHNRIGIALKDIHEYDNALIHFREAFKLTFFTNPSDKKYSAFVLHNQGLVYFKQGKYKQALGFYRRAVRILMQETGSEGPGIAQFYNSIGRVYLYIGDFTKALEYQLKALRIREYLMPDHVMNAFSYADIADIYSHQKNYDKALEYHRRALELRQKLLPSDHHNTAWSLHQVGKTYDKKGDVETARNYYLKSLEMTRKCLPTSQNHYVPNILMDIASTYDKQSKEAIEYLL
ncbi:unnamed protein product [Rotaria sp. Silwood1]|nr:unnamed protein product [Rotaria sp. Silwood1]CAF1687404.1 unnamed protein product [Rotaria sp. Silwood1]CAF3670181.1 unnamed protein product [Rotaria sp. Silwood1]CAF3909789.1 unnamed protein product [Rotaria sp. Silwood1]CAF3935313.1 unnamed protein product [Rotaria sp. Silwood1]